MTLSGANRAYVGLGSNLGDSPAVLAAGFGLGAMAMPQQAQAQDALTREGGSIPRRLAYGAAVLIGFNTHIVTTLIAGSLILPFLLIAAQQRDWSYFRALLLPPLAVLDRPNALLPLPPAILPYP